MLEDLGSQWTDLDYIYGHLGVLNEDVEQRLQNLGLNVDTYVVILPNVPANTVDLSAFQADGQPLAGMIDPIVIEWRLQGQSQQDWIPVPRVDKVLDTDTGTGEAGAAVVSDVDAVVSYEVRKGIVIISPCNQPTDIRVRGQFFSALLNADSPNQPVRGLVNILTYAVCYSITMNHSGDGAANTQRFEKRFNNAIAYFEATQNQDNQAKTQRFGGRRSAYAGSGFGPWRPPVL